MTINTNYSSLFEEDINTDKYRVYVTAMAPAGKIDSFRKIPLVVDENAKTYNMITEIPKFTRRKFELDIKEENSPIKQDKNKDGSLRVYKYGNLMFNYGAFPQTFEDPNVMDKHIEAKGDNDPLDVIEVGCRRMKSGTIAEVKILGIIAMEDQGEADWKVIALRTDDPLASKINNGEDLERELPGTEATILDFLIEYKTYEGKKRNTIKLGGIMKGKDLAYEVIKDSHESYKKLFN